MEDFERASALVGRILAVTNSENSKPFYFQAIERHGLDRVAGQLSDLEHYQRTGAGTENEVKDPAAYFTWLLKQLDAATPAAAAEAKPNGKALTCFFDSPEELYAHLLESPNEKPLITYTGKMLDPFSDAGIPWPTFMGPEWITLSTNKKKADEVTTTIRLNNGTSYDAPLLRGQGFRGDNEWGILKPKDRKILRALTRLWINAGSKKTEGEVEKCWVDITIRQLAAEMGYTNFGGNNLKDLKRDLTRLESLAYGIDFKNVPGSERFGSNVKRVKFIELSRMTDLTQKGGKKTAMVMRVHFSEFYSRQLLARKVVTRAKRPTKQLSELAELIQDYIESRVRAGEDGFEITLTNLIARLFLPFARWHRFKSKRKQVFSKALKELNTATTWEGDPFAAEIVATRDGRDFKLRVRRAKVVELRQEWGDLFNLRIRPALAAYERNGHQYMGDHERALRHLAASLLRLMAKRAGF